MVIMPARNVIDQAIRIRNAKDRPFAHEIHVRTPYQMKARLKEGDCDWFLREVVDKGKVLYEAPHGRDVACFHCQQAAEKYIKALLQDHGLAVPRTHDLEVLLDLLLPHDATLAPLRRGVRSLTKFAVEYRYPAMRATTRQMQASVRQT